MGGIRMTGLISGMDTESMVKELVKASSSKVDKVKQDKQKLEWKKEAWQGLNTQLYDFYKTELSAMKTNSTFKGKAATVSDSTKVSVKATAGAANGTHSVSVKQLASSAYLTGKNIKDSSATYTTQENANVNTKFSDMTGSENLIGKSITVTSDDGQSESFVLGQDGIESLADLNAKMQEKFGVESLSANFVDGKITFANGSAKTNEAGETTGHKYTIDAASSFGVSGEIDYKKGEDGNTDGMKLVSDSATTVPKTFGASDITGKTKLSDLGISVGTTFSVNGKDLVVDEGMTLSSFASELSKKGVNANYDEARGRFYVNASGTGSENDFDITVKSGNAGALDALGLDKNNGAKKIDAQDAIIDYNGVEYKGSSNTFDINGLSITAKSVTGKYDKTSGEFTEDSPIQVDVSADVDSAYKSIKNFVNKYNELIDKMNKLYNETNEGYDPLTDDERNALSDDQIEKWEEKAKVGLLRRDSTIGNLLSSMRTILNKGIEVTDKDGNTKTVSLASLGIVTGDYSEKGKLHILGDEDDPLYSAQENKLKAALADDASVFAQALAGTKDKPGIAFQMYDRLQTAMKKTESSSSLTFYNDISLKDEIEDKDDELDKWAEKLQKMEDKYYKQFGAMETAMAKLQEQQSYISQLMGM
ncbi:MAG: flagellar filament capping protein FliD [Lachnospiraceae bacterium]|nr:flagellar filament capping protein FliD [Lachnospiraceae bacterium]